MESNWKGYLDALSKQKIPKPTIDTKPFPTTEGNNTSSGFVEWKTQNPNQQAKYDAMSLKWEGVKASENASTSSIYKAEYMPVKTNNLKINNNSNK
jgi:hypothetical protein